METLKKWTRPNNYIGAEWPEMFVFLGQHRDSDCLTRSNFRVALKELGGESDTVQVIRENHWAVGWVEWIGINGTDQKSLSLAQDMIERLENYPILDESDLSEEEQTEADAIWQNCYNASQRIAYIRKHRYQFEFRNLEDMLGCVRGNYFAGYASELID